MAGDLSTQRFNRDEYLSPITTGSPARDDDSGRPYTAIPEESIGQNSAPHLVISTEAKRSGEISRRCGASPMVAGDLSAQRFNKFQSLYPPISAGPPLEIRMSMSSIQSFSGGSTDQNAAPHLVISTEAKRSGEISRRREEAPWWQKISRLSVSIESKAFTPHISRSPARDDDNIRQPIIICDKPKGAVKKW